MKRIILFLLVTIGTFVGTYWLLNQVNWISLFQIKETENFVEKELGDLMKQQIELTEKVVDEVQIKDCLEQIKDQICESNSIPKDQITVEIIQTDEVNAFAILGGHIYFTTQILKEMDTPEEVAGVMAHEIAHIHKGHLRKKLIRTFGISVLTSTATGMDATVIKELITELSSTAFDRSSEKEADTDALSYMTKAEIDPQGLILFFEKLQTQEGVFDNHLVWLSTHPSTSTRISYLKREIERMPEFKPKTVISKKEWKEVKDILDEY